VKFRKLGDSELQVSEVCLGTMTFGRQNTIEQAHQLLDVAFERGVNFLDIAEMYPVPVLEETQGRSEQYVGEWLAGKPRDRVIVATKISGSGRNFPWIRGGSQTINRQQVRVAVEDSLRRLKTDYIDLYQIHWPDRYVPSFGGTSYDPEKERTSTPIAEQLAALADVIRAGKVRYFGLSNETAWGITTFNQLAVHLGLPKPVSVQNAYSLLNRSFESGPAEASRRERVPLLPYSPLGFGLLTGKYVDGPPKNSRLALFEGFGQRYRAPNVDVAVRDYLAVAKQHGVSPVELALGFVKSRWFVGSTIIGATAVTQLEENLKAFDVTLSPEALADIDRVQSRYPSPAP